jgi:hypothetical protein
MIQHSERVGALQTTLGAAILLAVYGYSWTTGEVPETLRHLAINPVADHSGACSPYSRARRTRRTLWPGAALRRNCLRSSFKTSSVLRLPAWIENW